MNPHLLPLLIFTFTYLGMALGRFPGLALDRTGVAILGAVLLLATGGISLDDARTSIDAPTMAVLFGMMLLSVLYQLSGLYRAISDRLARMRSPRALLFGTILVSGLLSAVLTNDVVCFALTPLLIITLRTARLDPMPYLLALACSSNIGSAMTPIGNPQNILISQRMSLPFLPFLVACALPVAASTAALYFMLAGQVPRETPAAAAIEPTAITESIPTIDSAQATKAVILTVAAIILFLLPIPTYITALAIAGVVLTSRKMHTRPMLALVDWHLLALFAGLFVVVRGLELSGWTEASQDWLLSLGADLRNPLIHLPVVVVLGNLVGNVPAVMLLLPFVNLDAPTGHGLALASTFAGNAILPGSIANIIVAEQAHRMGVHFGFREHLKLGLPITAVSLVTAAIAVWFW